VTRPACSTDSKLPEYISDIMLKDLINEAGMAAKVSCNSKNNVASVTKSRDYADPDVTRQWI